MLSSFDGVSAAAAGTRSYQTHEIKVAIIGAKEVGKTTIASVFRDQCGQFTVYDPLDDDAEAVEMLKHLDDGTYVKTEGADLFQKTVTMHQISDAMNMQKFGELCSLMSKDRFKVTLWDTAGFENYGKFPPSNVLRGCNVLLVCFSCVNYDSISKAATLVEYAANSGLVARGCVCMVMGTKVDLLAKKWIQPRAAVACHSDDGDMFKEATLSWMLDAYEEYYRPEKGNNNNNNDGVGGMVIMGSAASPRRNGRSLPPSLNTITKAHVREAIMGLMDKKHMLHETWWILGDGAVGLETYGGETPGPSFDLCTTSGGREILLPFTSSMKVRHGSFVNPVYCIYRALGIHLERKVLFQRISSGFSFDQRLTNHPQYYFDGGTGPRTITVARNRQQKKVDGGGGTDDEEKIALTDHGNARSGYNQSSPLYIRRERRDGTSVDGGCCK